MAQKQCKGTKKLSVFKGREAKLNRAIFQILLANQPKTIWEITKQITSRKGLKRTRYHTVNTRVRALENASFLRKAGAKETKAGGKATLYETTAKTLLALRFDSLSIDELIGELDESTAMKLAILIAAK